MKTLTLKAELRTEFGKKAAKAARREGMSEEQMREISVAFNLPK